MNKIHYQVDLLERYIPISLEMLVSDLLSSKKLEQDQVILFSQFCTRYISLFHAQSHTKLKLLKNIYQPFNPDRDTLIINQPNLEKQSSQFKSEIYKVLEDANYEKISESALNAALNKISPHGVKVSVDFDDFSEVALFFRGSAIQTKLHRNWKQFKFKKQETEIQVFRRLFVLLQPKNKKQWIQHLIDNKGYSRKKATKQVETSLKALKINGEEHIIYMKLFKDIPRADLEMLFPNTRVQIRLFDKIKLGVMGGGGTAGGVMAAITKLSATIDPVSGVIAVGGLLGVIWRQIAKIFSQRAKYSAILTKNLYFYNLNNNMGTLNYLSESAEAEECKEAILAYFFLLSQGPNKQNKIDKLIENYILQTYQIPMNFDIDDGIVKLQQAQLISSHHTTISAIPLDEANKKLLKFWHNVLDNNTLPN